MEEWVGTVKQGGLIVARSFCSSRGDCERETMHYARLYAEEGPVVVEFKRLKKPRAA